MRELVRSGLLQHSLLQEDVQHPGCQTHRYTTVLYVANMPVFFFMDEQIRLGDPSTSIDHPTDSPGPFFPRATNTLTEVCSILKLGWMLLLGNRLLGVS